MCQQKMVAAVNYFALKEYSPIQDNIFFLNIFLNQINLRIRCGPSFTNLAQPMNVLYSGEQKVRPLGSQAQIWSHLEPFGAIWCYLESFGAILSQLEPFGANLEPLFLFFLLFLLFLSFPLFLLFLIFLPFLLFLLFLLFQLFLLFYVSYVSL